MFFGFRPELMLLLTLLFAMIHEPLEAAFFGFCCGFVQDLLVGRFIGLYACTLVLIALAVGFATKRMYQENFVVRLLAVFAGTALGQVLYLLGTVAFGLAVSWQLATWYSILGTSIINGVISLFMFRPLVAMDRRLIYWDELLKRTG